MFRFYSSTCDIEIESWDYDLLLSRILPTDNGEIVNEGHRPSDFDVDPGFTLAIVHNGHVWLYDGPLERFRVPFAVKPDRSLSRLPLRAARGMSHGREYCDGAKRHNRRQFHKLNRRIDRAIVEIGE